MSVIFTIIGVIYYVYFIACIGVSIYLAVTKKLIGG